jgi:hypothetical protein
MVREVLSSMPRPRYSRAMNHRGVPGTIAKTALLIGALVAASNADAQTRHRQQREPKEVERPIPAAPIDKRDSVITAPGPYSGRPYWAALAQCGGVYFKLNTFYADIAAHARAVKPDPRLVTEYTKKLNDAIKTATLYFSGAEHFLMTDRGIERIDAVLTYSEQSRAAGDRVKTIDSGLAAVKACPALYQACQDANAKACGEPLPPIS